ncbi:MAG: phage holin family protein [Opitutaceae bacterium]|jgi:putative membrane protein|nr:phage holin family protein [Opitutaceae bacterium]
MNHPMIQLLVRWSVLALGVTLATKLVPGIQCNDASTLVIVVVLLSFLNAVLKPLLVLFTLPFILFTLGLGIVLINAFLFLLVSRVVDGFYVVSFGSAFFGAIIVSVTNMILTNMLRKKGPPPGGGKGRGGKGPGSRRSPDVIDV